MADFSSAILFNMYINDMPANLKFVKSSLYADDAKLYAPIKEESSISRVQEDLDSLSSWCRAWRLRLNASKCFLLHYVPQNISSLDPKYEIDGTPLEKKNMTSDLGVIVTEDLKFHEQVLNACKKATKEINTIKRTFTSRNPKFLENLYKSCVRPHLEYCVQVWNPGYAGDINLIEKVQNRYSRLLPQSRIMNHNERNSILRITDHKTRRLRGDLVYIFKYYDDGLFSHNVDTRTRGHSKKLNLEMTQNNIRKHSFVVRNVAIWNSLPETIVSAPSVDSFKARLDIFLQSNHNI